MKTRNISIWAITALTASLLAAPVAYSQTERFSANLVGANEVPSINTAGTGEFRMQIVGSDINFSLSFSDLSSNLTVAHLHFADSKVAGGVMIFLCGGGGHNSGHCRRRPRLGLGGRALRFGLCQHAHGELRRR
jgi:hypothetical protein